MLEAECPECQQTVWITSDTRFATYHSVGTPPADCPGSRMIVPVPPTPAAVRRAAREAARAAAIAASPRRQKNEAIRAQKASLARQAELADQADRSDPAGRTDTDGREAPHDQAEPGSERQAS